MKNFNYKPLINYTKYFNKKYIVPEKAGTDKEKMKVFKENGQEARKIFSEIAESFEKELLKKFGNENEKSIFHLQKVSSWMNQARVGRPYFWAFFKRITDTREDSGIALRLFSNESFDGCSVNMENSNSKTKEVGISLEVSFLERGKGENTILKQNRILELPIKEPLYYLVQIDGENFKFKGTEKNRKKLIEDVKENRVRKVLIKYDVENIVNYKTLDSLNEQFLKGFELLLPYYEKAVSEF